MGVAQRAESVIGEFMLIPLLRVFGFPFCLESPSTDPDMASSSSTPTATADTNSKTSIPAPANRITLTEQHVAQLYAEIDKVRSRRRSSFTARRLSDASTIPSIRPGMTISPSTKIVYNAPFDEEDVCKVKITNTGDRRVGWAIKISNSKHAIIDPPSGLLEPCASLLVAVIREPMRKKKAIRDDVLMMTWVVASDGTGQPNQFGLSGCVKLLVEYNE
uniref:Major sperm protein n=1 Tax=Panagrellus redivivus TaxID=6233 RepID=A0A7E4V1D3_PANRE